MHIKALDAVVASVRTRIDQGDCPVEQVHGVEILEEAVVQLADRLDGLEWNGCLTGDCPHDTQAECDKHLADELRRTFSVPAIAAPSSAEPAPPTTDARKLGLIEFALKAHRFIEAEDFDDRNAAGEIAAHCSCGFICSPEGNEWMTDHRIAWERHVAAAILAAKPSYSVVMDTENSPLSPVQEEATPTPKPLSRTAMAIAALVGGAGEQGIPKERLAPMLYMADVLAREYLGHPITDIEWTTEAVAALPTKVSFVELAKLLGVEAFFSDSEDGRTSVPSDGINRLRDTLSELQDVLSGSISERETLTARIRHMEAQPDRDILLVSSDRLAGAVCNAVDRHVLDARSPAGDALLDYAQVRYDSRQPEIEQVRLRYAALRQMLEAK